MPARKGERERDATELSIRLNGSSRFEASGQLRGKRTRDARNGWLEALTSVPEEASQGEVAKK